MAAHTDVCSLSDGEVDFLNRQSIDFVHAPLRSCAVKISGFEDGERKASILNTINRARRWRSYQKGCSAIIPLQGFVPVDEQRRYLELASSVPELIPLTQHLQQNNPSVVMIHNIIEGVDFLHSLSFVHGAIHISNVFIRPDGTCCLGEFSGEIIPSRRTLDDPANVGYIAPELLDVKEFRQFIIDDYRQTYNGEYAMRSDVFAMGATINHIVKGEAPAPIRIDYDKVKDAKLLSAMAGPPIDLKSSQFPTHIQDIVIFCLKPHPSDRPNATWLLEKMKTPRLPLTPRASYGNAKALSRRASRQISSTPPFKVATT